MPTDCEPVTWTVRVGLDVAADRLAALAGGHRPVVRDGEIQLRLGSVVLYRLLGVRLVASRFPVEVRVTASGDGVRVTVRSRDPWTPVRFDRERRAYADRVAAVRSTTTHGPTR